MLVRRPDASEIASTATNVGIDPALEILVDAGDCCVVTRQSQVIGRIDAGQFALGQLPFGAHLLASPSPADFTFVYSRPFGPLKLGGRMCGVPVIAEATIAVTDPITFLQQVVGNDPSRATEWVSKSIRLELERALAPLLADPDAAPTAEAVSPLVVPGLAASFGPYGLAFGQLTMLKLVGRGAPAPAATVDGPPDGRVQLLGPIAGKADTPVADESVAKWERFGLFVAGDPLTIGHYSGSGLGWRWVGRGAGSLMDHVHGWPLAPDGSTDYHFATEEQARAYYGALRTHAFQSVPGLQPQDTRQEDHLNAPSGWSETIWHQGEEVFYLLYDHVQDMQALCRETDTIGIYAGAPPSAEGPRSPLFAFKSVSDTHYVGVAKGADNAADHVLVVHSNRHAPVPTITDGLPRAEWMQKYEEAGVAFAGNLLVLLWGRFAGADVLAGEDLNDPIPSLTAKLGDQVAMPLPVQHEAASRISGAGGYVVRMQPGQYSLHYYELHTDEHGDFNCCAISRDGAESFMPVTVGNAGGVRLGGLTVEQYAMLSVERDNLIAQQGPQACVSPQMAEICQRHGIPHVPGGMAGRIDEWEQYIANDAAFSAQWVTHRSMAMAKLQGQQLDEHQMAAMAGHQQMVQQAVEQQANQLDAIRDAAIHIIQMAGGVGPGDCIAMVQQHYPQLGVENVLYKAVRILREPDEYGRFDHVESCTEPLCRAHYQSMDADEQRDNKSEDAYFKEQRSDVYGSYNLEVPGLFNKLFG